MLRRRSRSPPPSAGPRPRPLGHSSKNDHVELAEIAARAAGENFPVGSVLFPRHLRPHIRALYCYARFVDELGDAYEGDRLAALDELEGEVDAAFAGEATWPVLRNVQPTIREFELPREPFLRLIEANRMDQRVSEYETWADVKHYCVHSADPCGRLVLGVLRRLDEPELVAASDSVCTGLQLVNFLQDVPRDLELGRVYLPAEDRRTFGDPPLDRPTRGAARAAAVRGAARGRASRRGRGAARTDRRQARPGGRALLPRRPRRPRRARVGRLGHLQRPPTAVPGPPRARGRAGTRAIASPRDERRGGVRRGRPDHAARGEELRLRDHGAAAGEAAGDRRDLRVRASGGRRRRRRPAAGGEAGAARGASCARSTATAPIRCSWRSRMRASGSASRASRSRR